MKAAVIVPGFSANEQDWCIPALLDFVRVLAQHAEVHVFTLRWPERGGTYRVYGATVHALNGRRGMGPRVAALWARAVRAIAAEHRRGPFDVIHAFWLDEPGWVAAWAGQRLGVPVVLSLAGGELCRMDDIDYGLLRLPGRGLLLRAAVRRAVRVTAGSRYLCRLARGYFAQYDMNLEPHYAPLGVDLARFHPPSTSAPGPRIVNVGSLGPVKNQVGIVQAFRGVVAKQPDAELLIIGEGPMRTELAALAAGLPVRFLGGRPHDELPQVYAGSTLMVQGSRHEAQGMAVLEAAACGVPVVGTPVGVLPDLGLAAMTSPDLTTALLELLCDEKRRSEQAAAALAIVRAEYALDIAVERFLSLYVEVTH